MSAGACLRGWAHNKVSIAWVKAHAQHAGNEQTDQLAKLGANQTIGPARFKYFEAIASFISLSFSKKQSDVANEMGFPTTT
jgi:ribonuclease HI